MLTIDEKKLAAYLEKKSLSPAILDEIKAIAEPEKGAVMIGYALETEAWKEAANRINTVGGVVAGQLRRINADGKGDTDAEEVMADFALAVTAMCYVATFAADKCRFIPNGGSEK